MAFIATNWLFHQITARHLQVLTVYKILFQGSERSSEHVVVLLASGGFLCDCCMATNLGVPCRHYFALLRNAPHLRFSIAFVQPRYGIPYFIALSSLTDATGIPAGFKIRTWTSPRSPLSP